MKHRLNLELSERDHDALKEVVDLLGATSMAEGLRRSVDLATKILEYQRSGKKIFLKEPDGTLRELIFS